MYYTALVETSEHYTSLHYTASLYTTLLRAKYDKDQEVI